MKKINLILRKCKSLSRQLGRSYSYSSLRSQSTREEGIRGSSKRVTVTKGHQEHDHEQWQTVVVGSTRKRYMISSRYLKHPLLNALIERSSNKNSTNMDMDAGGGVLVVKCEVVLFDHLLWMLENADQNLILESLDELADLYLF